MFILLKLLLTPVMKTYGELGAELGMSASEVHSSVKRSTRAGLIHPKTFRPLRKPLEDYVLYGVPYAFPGVPGPVVRGMPTSYAATPLREQLEVSTDLPPVWPDAKDGTARGYTLEPLYPSAPFAARKDAKLYELLALVDALREGRAREKNLAIKELQNRISKLTNDTP
ncbi:MAG: hypothetical protein ABIP97_09200 [Chthoniobacterales bacterium]